MSRQKAKIRARSYRRFLFTEAELVARESALVPAIQAVERAWRSAGLGAPEVVARYILQFLKVMRPQDYLGGRHGHVLHNQTAGREGESLEIFAHRSLRSCPLAVNRSLVAWSAGEFHLHLLDHVPDAATILRLQAAGERVVTCFFKPEELVSYQGRERDPLGFVLHDLIHADHFFRDTEMARAQREFYGELLRRYENGEYGRWLDADPHFVRDFEYVISDMNSHPQHLEQTLQAAVFKSEKRQVLSLS